MHYVLDYEILFRQDYKTSHKQIQSKCSDSKDRSDVDSNSLVNFFQFFDIKKDLSRMNQIVCIPSRVVLSCLSPRFPNRSPLLLFPNVNILPSCCIVPCHGIFTVVMFGIWTKQLQYREVSTRNSTHSSPPTTTTATGENPSHSTTVNTSPTHNSPGVRITAYTPRYGPC